jgi:hypothetical protein
LTANLAFTLTHPSTERQGSLFACFLNDLGDRQEPRVIGMKKKTQVLATEDDLLLDLTFHGVPASLLSEFAEKIVKPYYSGNMNAAIQDLLRKTLSEQDLVLSHITHIKSAEV